MGAKALVINDGKVLILREAPYDEGSNEGRWDVPGGRINPEESLLTGLKREVMEEGGLEIEAGEVLGVFESFQTIKGEECHIIRIYYQVKAVTSEVVLSSDHDEYEWVDPQNPDKREFVNDVLEMFEKVIL